MSSDQTAKLIAWLEAHGFETENTGGGCEAYSLEVMIDDEAGRILVSGEDCNLPEPGEDFVCIGLYTDNDGNIIDQDEIRIGYAITELEKYLARIDKKGETNA